MYSIQSITVVDTVYCILYRPTVYRYTLYADDLIIIAISVKDLKLLLQLSLNYLDSIEMPININKSKCTRFGKRFNHLCAVSVGIMQWNTKFRYLGVTVVANKRFKSNFQSHDELFLAPLMQFMEE